MNPYIYIIIFVPYSMQVLELKISHRFLWIPVFPFIPSQRNHIIFFVKGDKPLFI